MSRFNDEADDYELWLIAETDKAWGVSGDNEPGGPVGWLPKSQVEGPGNAVLQRKYTFTVPNWLAEEKGMI